MQLFSFHKIYNISIRWYVIKNLRLFYITKSIIFCLILITSFQPLFSNNQRIVDVDSQYFRSIEYLYMSQGLGLPSESGPWSIGEMYEMLQNLPVESFSINELVFYQRILNSFENKKLISDFQASFHYSLQPEIYFHLNEGDLFDEDEEWFSNYENRKPIFSFSTEYQLNNFFYGFLQIDLRKNRFDTNGSTEYFSQKLGTNFLFDDLPINPNSTTPWRAFGSLGGEGWNFQIGRDKVSWGSGISGNLIVNQHMDYHEFFKFTLFGNELKYVFLGMSFTPPDYVESSDPIQSICYFFAHRFEFLPIKNLRISLTEGMLYQGKVFDFRYLNPFMIYHNYYMDSNSNSIFGIEITYGITKGFAFYGQFVLDQFAVPGEASTGVQAQPSAFGYLGGLSYTFITKKGVFSVNLEGAFTDPYLYLRDSGQIGESIPIDFIVGYRQPQTSFSSKLIDEDFLGYPFGCDAIVFDFIINYDQFPLGFFQAETFFMVHGTHDQYTKYEKGDNAIALTTPTKSYADKNAIETTIVQRLFLSRLIMENLEFYGEINIMALNNGGNVIRRTEIDVQVTLGTHVSW